MFNQARNWLISLCFAIGCGAISCGAIGCGNDLPMDNGADAAQPMDAPPKDANEAPIDATNWREILRDTDEPLQRRIDAAFVGIDADTCFLDGGDVSHCAWDTFEAGAAYVDPELAPGEAVLISDVLVPAVEMLRYRNRVLGFYEVLSDGTIGAMPLSWELPQVFGDIVTGFASAPAITSESLDPLLPRLKEVYSASVPTLGTHGLTVFNIMADLTPQNPLVFLDINRLPFHQSIPEVVCAIDADSTEADLAPLRAHAQQFADDLRTLLATHNIRFVNASWGYTIETVRGPWERVCDTEVPPEDVLLAILDAYRPIFEALFNTEGVFTAHAALASPNDAHSPFDQYDPIEFPNRLRVGVFQHPGGEVPPEGQVTVPNAWFPEPGADDADVWVNNGCDYVLGCRDERPLSFTLQYGMGRSEFPFAQSSFVNPILLGAFIHFRNQMPGEGLDDTLISDVIARLIPECAFGLNTICRYIDPLLHQQLDRYGP